MVLKEKMLHEVKKTPPLFKSGGAYVSPARDALLKGIFLIVSASSAQEHEDVEQKAQEHEQGS